MGITSLRILVVGGGGREHALIWKLSQSPRVGSLFCAPGNSGTARLATNLACSADALDDLVRLVREQRIDLVVIGPELPLSKGLADRLRVLTDAVVFGPSQRAAQLESSKVWAKKLMQMQSVPTAEFEFFDNITDAERYVQTHRPASYVIKADGLAAGKGVFLPKTVGDASKALRVSFGFGSAVLFEKRLSGHEVSVFGFVSDNHISNLVAACDYKRLEDGDGGPNTGGMGCYLPPEFWTSELEQSVMKLIFEPVVQGLAERGAPYRGILYAGLIVDRNHQPQVLEFNCRFGDPECQLLMPALNCDLAEICMRVGQGQSIGRVERSVDACVGVVAVSSGYPDAYTIGKRISGVEHPQALNTAFAHAGSLTFHSGTAERDGDLVSDGGRVLTVVGCGSDLETARGMAYNAIAKIEFEGMCYRTDIAGHAVQNARS